MKKLAIGSWAFLFDQEQPISDFHDLVHHIANLGYEGVELGGFAPHPGPDSFASKESRQKLAKMTADHGLEFSALAADLWSQKLVSTADPGPYLAVFEKNLDFAADLGIKTIRIDTAESLASLGQHVPDVRLMIDRVAAAFDLCAKRAANRGIAVSWEFDPAFPLHQSAETVEVVHRVRDDHANPNFGILFNTCHAEVCGGATQLLEMLKGKINHIHLADSDGTLNAHGTSKRVPLGKGRLNFDRLAPVLFDCGAINDWWVVDLCFVPDALQAAADCRRFLDRLRKKYAT